MKKIFTPVVIALMFFMSKAYCQQQLYFENFQGSTSTFTINYSSLGTNHGNNKWIINANYFAGGIYPNTINEDSTYGGTISYAPYGKYMHIYDSSSGYLNDNYNPSDSSTRFASMTSGICTKSLTNINFNFFYLCQGSATAYGEVYYSINGGPWTQTGSPMYNNRHKWQYATVTDPAFANVEDLKFGFLWHNNSTAGRDTSALGIDDVSIFGTYDSIAHPITCSFLTLGFDSCLGGSEYVFIQASLSDSTCDAVWDMDMSDGNGNFPGSYAWYQSIGPSYYNDITSYWYLTLPSIFSTVGHCYKFKLVRTSYPFLTFIDSVCFPFDSCAGSITALQPPATLDTNAVCAGSVVDIPFLSSGIFRTTNIYYAELIDSVGTSAIIDTIGNLPSNVAYSTYSPGDVVSTIPLTVPAGCKYYIRVVSTTPNRAPIECGPFCIQHCDILTNNQQSLHVCLASCQKQAAGFSDTIGYNIHEFESLAHYYSGNKFEVQLIQYVLYPPSFSAINTGLLGILVDTASGRIYVHIPCPDTLLAHGINPGVYYMRIIADSSSFTDSAFGSLVSLSIGEPADSLFLTVIPATGPYCAGATITFNTNPDDQFSPYNSIYSWWETDKTRGTFLFTGTTTGYLGLNSVADTFLITCQETNYGCPGNKATLPDTIIVLGAPSIVKTGPATMCVGDTGIFSIPFADNTSYYWRISASAHSDTANNILKVKFDTSGIVRISVSAFNACFSDSAVWNVHVYAKPIPLITGDTIICKGNSTTLFVSGGTSYKWSTGSTKDSIHIVPTVDSTFWVKVSNAGCFVYDTVNVIVKPVLPTPTITYTGGVFTSSAATGNQWLRNNVPLTGRTKDTLITSKAGCYSTMITDTDGCPSVSDTICLSVVGIPTVISEDGVNIYPNPSDGKFVVEMKDEKLVIQNIEVVNVIGETIFSESEIHNAQTTLDLSSQSSGVYFVHLIIGNQTINRKIVLMR